MASMTTLYPGNTQYVSAGQTDSGTDIAGGTQVVNAGGTANNAYDQVYEQTSSFIYYYSYYSYSYFYYSNFYVGNQNVYGTTNYTSVWGGDQTVYAGGIANSTSVRGTGYLYGEYVYYSYGYPQQGYGYYFYDGYQNVQSGGSASGTSVYAAGVQDVYAGGTASGTSLQGGYYYYPPNNTNFFFDANQYDYGTATGTSINYGGIQWVFAGGTASATTINGGISKRQFRRHRQRDHHRQWRHRKCPVGRHRQWDHD
jgi:autotransporter passenger strand-loop-strand repeat protein